MAELVPVLVVEDEALLLAEIEMSLEEGGYHVIAARNGEEALRALTVNISDLRAVVTDIDIGRKELSGWDVARRAREAKPDIPVVYMTGASASEWTARGVPNSQMIPKPFAMAQMLTAVSKLVNENTRPLASD